MTKYLTTTLKNGKVSLTKSSIPNNFLADDSVIIAPIHIGICRADIKEVTGSRDIPQDRGPLFGHEFIGTILRAGKNTAFISGELVTFNPNITPQRTTGFSQLFFIKGTPKDLNEAIIKIPKDFQLKSPWEPEPLACIIHSVDKALNLLSLPNFLGMSVGIIGMGNSGLEFGMYIKYLGGSVHWFNRGQMRIDFALNNKLCSKNEVSLLADSQKYPKLFDLVLVCPTKVDNSTLVPAFSLVKDKGFILVYGGTRDGDKFLDNKTNIDIIRRKELLTNVSFNGKEISILGAYGCYKRDFLKAFDLVKNNPTDFPVVKLISEVISINNFPHLIEDMANDKVDFPGKVIVLPNGKDTHILFKN